MKRISFFFLCLLCLTGFMSASAHAFDVRSIRVGEHPDKFRLVIELSEARDFRVFVLTNPSRIAVDLPHFNWQAAGSLNLPVNAGINSVRHGVLNSDMSRIVFDMRQESAIVNSFLIPAQGSTPNRLVIDFAHGAAVNTPSEQVFGHLQGQGGVVQGAQPVVVPVAPPRPSPPLAVAKKPLIVIDAGHGGQDPGAVSGSYYEKNITMDLARILKRDLEGTGLFNVHLTRDDDRFIKLHDRIGIARDRKADLFISLHADSIDKSDVRGASVYTLSEKASDAQTAKLAARENKADLIAGIDLSHEDADVAGILLDLVQRDTMNQSNYFAEKIVKNFKGSGIRTLDNPHRSAGFAVLKAPDIPSVLIEAGFVSNQQDAKLLSSTAHQSKISASIADAVEDYFERIGQNGSGG